MKLVRIPSEQLDKVWSLIEKDIKDALAYSNQLTDSDFVLEVAKQDKFQVWVLWDKDKDKTIDKYFGGLVTGSVVSSVKLEYRNEKIRHACSWAPMISKLFV